MKNRKIDVEIRHYPFKLEITYPGCNITWLQSLTDLAEKHGISISVEGSIESSANDDKISLHYTSTSECVMEHLTTKYIQKRMNELLKFISDVSNLMTKGD